MTHRHEPWFKVLSHHHHSLELEQVEARVVEVAEVTAHAMYFRFSPSLNHQQVMELEAILVNVQADVVGQADLAVQEEVPGVAEVVDLLDQKERQDHPRK